MTAPHLRQSLQVVVAGTVAGWRLGPAAKPKAAGFITCRTRRGCTEPGLHNKPYYIILVPPSPQPWQPRQMCTHQHRGAK